MTIILVILKALTLILAIILLFLVNKAIKRILSIMTDYYTCLVDHFINLNNNVDKQANTIVTAVNDARTDTVRLANKVDEGLTHCGNQTRDLKEKIGNLETRITAPIDKINDTHNRIKTLGKGATSTEELRTVVADVVSAIATEAVDSVCKKCTPKPKTTKKVTKEPVAEVKA